jgi:ribosomal protein S18 acetylase RimI-like enzyme
MTSADADAAVDVVIGGAEWIDALEPLWLSLFDHHRSVGPGPFIPRDESWAIRRRLYEKLLTVPDAFVVIARLADELVGYAMVAIHEERDDTWPTGDTFAEVETLAILPEGRGQGLGTLMLDIVDRRLEELDIHSLFVGVMDGNDDAMRFYRRRGLVPSVTMLMRLGPPRPDDP